MEDYIPRFHLLLTIPIVSPSGEIWSLQRALVLLPFHIKNLQSTGWPKGFDTALASKRACQPLL